MMKYLLWLLFAILVIESGNLFWHFLYQSISSTQDISSDTGQIIFVFLTPILIFGIYLASLLQSYLVWDNIWLLGIITFFSLTTFLLTLHITVLTVICTLAVGLSLIAFPVSYTKIHVTIKKFPSLYLRYTTALGAAAFIISIVSAVTFYHIFETALSANHVILQNKVVIDSLRPVIRSYYQNLHVTKPTETVHEYIVSQSRRSRTTPESVEKRALDILDLPTLNPNDTMSHVVVLSLENSVLQIYEAYRKIVPILISLGLAVIMQTILFVSMMVGYLLFKLLNLFVPRLLRAKKKEKS